MFFVQNYDLFQIPQIAINQAIGQINNPKINSNNLIGNNKAEINGIILVPFHMYHHATGGNKIDKIVLSIFKNI